MNRRKSLLVPRRWRWSGFSGAAFSFFLSLSTVPFAADPPAVNHPPPSPWRILDGELPRTTPIDAFPLCVPSELQDDSFETPLESREALETVHKRLAERIASAGEGAPRELQFLAALVQSRIATDPKERANVRGTLAEFLSDRLTPSEAVCGRLEIARLELWLRRYPEAAAQAVLAERLRIRVRDPATVHESAQFIRGEAFYLARRYEEAAERFRALVSGKSKRIAAAARLRLADVRLDRGSAGEAWVQYEALLPHASEFGASPSQWSVRAAEALLARGDVEAALERFERIQASVKSEQAAALASIRIADLLALEGKLSEARSVLEKVAEKHPGSAIGQLAQARAVQQGADPSDLDARVERMKTIADQSNSGLSLYGRSVLAQLLLKHDRAEEALEVLTRLAFSDPAPDLAPGVSDQLGRALLALTSATPDIEDCTEWVDRLGWRREFLLQQVSEPEPFIRLGTCYEQLGFPKTAIEVYRSIAKRFGPVAADRVAYPLARAALSAGDVPVARAAAAARSKRGGAQAGAWRLLLAEAQVADGRPKPAHAILRKLVEKGEPKDERVQAVLLLARVSARLKTLVEDRELLRRSLNRLTEAERTGAGEELGEAALLTGEAHRHASELPQARRFYELAVVMLPEGARRQEAAYWARRLGHDGDDPSHASSASGPGPAGNWSTLSDQDRALSRLEKRIGVTPPAAEAPDGPR